MVRAARQAAPTLLTLAVLAAGLLVLRGGTGDDPVIASPVDQPVAAAAANTAREAEERRAEAAFRRREAAYEREARRQRHIGNTHEDCWGNKVTGDIPRSELVWDYECPAVRAAKRREERQRRREREARRRFLAGGPPTLEQLAATPEAGCGDRHTCPLLEVRARNAADRIARGAAEGRAAGVRDCTRQSPWEFACDIWMSSTLGGAFEKTIFVIQPDYQVKLQFR